MAKANLAVKFDQFTLDENPGPENNNVLAKLDLSDEELKRLKIAFKELRRKHMDSEKRFQINAKVASLTTGIKLFSCAYEHAIKDHKLLIQKASEIKNEPIRLLMIATIGLVASCFIILLMSVFKDQLALLLGFFTLIFSTLEYWFRKGILETYLLEWTKKASRFNYIQQFPDFERVSVYLIELEEQIKETILIQKKKVKLFQDPSFIRKEWINYVKNQSSDLSVKEYDKTRLLSDFERKLKTRWLEAAQELNRQTQQLTQGGLSSTNEYNEIKHEIEYRIWQLWLSEQSQTLIDQIKPNMKPPSKKHFRIISEKVFGSSDVNDDGFLIDGCSVGDTTPGVTANLYLDFVLQKYRQ